MEISRDLLKTCVGECGILHLLRSDVNLVLPSPIITELPIAKKWATTPEIDYLHQQLFAKLGMNDIQSEFTWKFNKRFKAIYAQAEYPASDGSGFWKIQYASKYWLLLAGPERKNLITHEMCHLAVEKHYGYNKVVNGKRVTSHGHHWRKFMESCSEDPDMRYAEELGTIVDQERFQSVLNLLDSIQNETGTAPGPNQSK